MCVENTAVWKVEDIKKKRTNKQTKTSVILDHIYKPAINRNPVLLLVLLSRPLVTNVIEQEYDDIFRDKSTLLTIRPDPLYECFGGRELIKKMRLLIVQDGDLLVPR